MRKEELRRDPAVCRKRQVLLSAEKGIALVMVMILAMISLAIMAALVYMITASTQVSGIMKRYTTSIEAGKGGAAVMFQAIAAGGDPGYIGTTLGGAISNNACFSAKLNNATSDWSTVAGSSCSDTSMTITPGTTTSYDMNFNLGTIPTYTVYAKIVDTVPGNSNRSVGGAAGLVTSGVVNANSGEIAVQSIPYMYTIEVQSVNQSNTAERTNYSILYEY